MTFWRMGRKDNQIMVRGTEVGQSAGELAGLDFEMHVSDVFRMAAVRCARGVM